MLPRLRNHLVVSAAALSAACSGRSDGGPGVPHSIAIQPEAAALCVGDSLGYAAEVLDNSGNPVLGAPVRWSSSAPENVSIDSVSGMARALRFGGARITARAGGVLSADSASAEVPQDLSPEFVPDTVVLAPGDTMTLGVRLRRISAGPAPSHTPIFAPLDTAPASLAANGLVTAKAAGTASLSLSACGFTGLGSVRVFTPQDSLLGWGSLWLSGPTEISAVLSTKVWNFTLADGRPAFQVYGGKGTNGMQIAYEDTLRLAGTGAYPLDSLLSKDVSSSLPCAPPGPFAVYGDASPTSLVSLRGGTLAVTTDVQRSGYAVISGRLIGRVRGIVGGSLTVDTLQVIYTFSAPLRDTTGVCP